MRKASVLEPKWVSNATHKREAWEIQQWSAYFNERGPDGDAETLSKFRSDIKTWFDRLDLDDHVTFGGKP